MPIETRDLDGGIGIFISATGVVTEEEYVEAHTKYLTQDKDKLQKYRYSLSDYTGVTGEKTSTEAISLIANLCKSAAKVNPYPVVAVVAKQDLIYGLARMSQLLMSETGWEHEVFRNREDAESWIKERVKEKYGIRHLTMA
ncbi:MAG: hypothetical protein ACYSSO_13860 [Planctomycetota bacterium]|jgi:hypothetical protein